MNNPTKKGYKFLGWSGTDIDGMSTEVIIPSGSTGNREYVANWQAITYAITYELDGGSTANVTEYTIESGTIVLSNPTKDYYDFVEWQLDGKKVTEITSGSYGDKRLVAIWTPTVYTITYELNGGRATNESTYTIESNSMILNNPTRTGYKFLGWSGTDIVVMSTHVVIPSGSTGNREYTANWEMIAYIITYELDGGKTTNVTEYTIESETIVLSKPTKDHYDFVEWQLDGEKVTEIEKGSYGNKTFVAVWTPIVYSIEYISEIDSSHNNRNSYTIETESFALNTPISASYEFLGWYLEDTYETKVEIIEKGSTGDVKFYAKWTTIFIYYNGEITGLTSYGKGMTEIVIPSAINGEAIKSIGANAFYGCTTLTSIAISNSIISIGYSAFDNCPLTSITIPDSVTSIGDYAFRKCPIKKAVIPANAAIYIKNNSLVEVIITSGDSIEAGAFMYCYNLTSITIPDTITDIGDNAFKDCFNLVEVLKAGLPTGVHTIMYGISNGIIQANINLFGTDIVAAWTAYSKIAMFFWTVLSAMGITVATFVSQNREHAGMTE